MQQAERQDRFEILEQSIEEFIENIRQMSIMVSDFQPQGQSNLNQKIHSMVVGLQEIDRCRSMFNNVQVPLQVFEYIDNGKNPQLYTKHLMEEALEKNKRTKGKIEAYQNFRNQLITEMKSAFPDVITLYQQEKSFGNAQATG